jgi:hypothetical protein
MTAHTTTQPEVAPWWKARALALTVGGPILAIGAVATAIDVSLTLWAFAALAAAYSLSGSP